jgi:diguanylate cyclase (GGDEF)-like protein
MSKWRNFASEVASWLGDRSRAQVDLAVIAILAVPLYLLLFYLNAFDHFHDWSRSHETWQLDEIIVLTFFLGLAFMAFSWRRLKDLKHARTERQDIEQRAFAVARRDVLTGLANRKCFVEEIGKWAYCLPADEECAVFIVDLDHFKPINDLYGHRLGDEVLRVVASRLSGSIEGQGLVARLAGDEFGVLLRYPKDSDAPIRVARRIVLAIGQPLNFAALSVQVGASVGVTTCDQENAKLMLERDGGHVEALLRQADMAMYRAKTEGRGRYRFFSPAMDAKLQARLKLESGIKAAIESGQIVPYYQPLLDLRSKVTLGYEVLARWEHPSRGLLRPSEFIPVAEDTGVISDLTDFLVRKVLDEAKRWSSSAYVSFNISSRQFADPWLVQKILGVVTETGFPPRRLALELTEAALADKVEEIKAALQSLRNLGVRVVLDNFGTGSAGLHKLRALQFDMIKIDQSLIRSMVGQPRDAKMVEAILALGRALDIEIAAVGIETHQTLEALIALGCEIGQGSLFGGARPFAEIPLPRGTEAAVRQTA